MKLYFSPGACSLSPHIVLREAGLPVELERVDLGKKLIRVGGDFLAITSKGSVPVLQLDDGSYLTEGPAIVQYIADQVPASGLAPAAGTMARYRLMEWLNFITSELHKGFSPLFTPGMPDEAKTMWQEHARIVAMNTTHDQMALVKEPQPLVSLLRLSRYAPRSK
jgi:glutathione S-transferase